MTTPLCIPDVSSVRHTGAQCDRLSSARAHASESAAAQRSPCPSSRSTLYVGPLTTTTATGTAMVPNPKWVVMLVLPHSSSRSRCRCFLLELEYSKQLGRGLLTGQIESRLDFEGDFRRGYRPFQDDVSLFLPAPDTTRSGWHT
jgi:hypothetical protein